MKRLVSAVVALIVLWAGAVNAQDLTGTWQGPLQGPQRELRIVIKVTREEAGTLRGVFYRIHQGGQGLPGSVTLQGSTVTMTISGAGATVEGKLNADGRSISGTFSQGPGKIPLNLVRVTEEAAWPIPETPAALKPMAADASLAFEVATIKPSRPETQGRLYTMRGREVVTINTSLLDLITFSYGMHPKQITGLPAWAEADHYDITGKPEAEGQPSLQQMKTMMQKLLAERFKLAFHRDKKELSVYALTVGRNGPKLTRSEGSPNAPPGMIFRGLGQLPATNASMTEFAGVMQNSVLDRPVVDQTELKGKWDFTLRWTPDESQFGTLGVRVPPPPDNATLPNLFTAIQEQLGLRLESTKAPADVIVIDKVEKPSEN